MMRAILRQDQSEIIVETPYDKGFVEALKASVPLDSRVWSKETRLWAVDVRFYECVLELCRLFFGEPVDAVGGTAAPQDTAWRGRLNAWTAKDHAERDARASRGRGDDKDYSTLYLIPGAPAAVVKAAYRELAKIHHSDHGGDGKTMTDINVAYANLQRRGAA